MRSVLPINFFHESRIDLKNKFLLRKRQREEAVEGMKKRGRKVGK